MKNRQFGNPGIPGKNLEDGFFAAWVTFFQPSSFDVVRIASIVIQIVPQPLSDLLIRELIIGG